MTTVVDDGLMMTIYMIYIFVHLTLNIWNDNEIQNKLHGKHVFFGHFCPSDWRGNRDEF